MQWGRTREELLQDWGLLCSIAGWSLKCLGCAQLTVNFGKQTIQWKFIVAEIRMNEGILGNDFVMWHGLTVRLSESAVYRVSRQAG